MDGVALKPELALAGVTALLQLGALYGVLKTSLKRLEHAQQAASTETQRLVRALHTRLDGMSAQVRALELEQARQDERMKHMQTTQRFKFRAAAAPGGGGDE